MIKKPKRSNGSAVERKPAPSAPKAKPSKVVETVGEVVSAGPIVEPKRIVDAITAAQTKKAEWAQDLLQDVFVESLETIQDASAAFDLDPDALDEIPASWRKELSDERAVKRRHRVAKAALQNNREAPVALQMATNVVQNVVRMQAKQHGALTIKRLNVAVVIGGTKHDYPELEMKAGSDHEDDR